MYVCSVCLLVDDSPTPLKILFYQHVLLSSSSLKKIVIVKMQPRFASVLSNCHLLKSEVNSSNVLCGNIQVLYGLSICASVHCMRPVCVMYSGWTDDKKGDVNKSWQSFIYDAFISCFKCSIEWNSAESDKNDRAEKRLPTRRTFLSMSWKIL